MQPTQQQVIPVALFQGRIGTGSTVIDLNPAYDHLISALSIFADTGDTGVNFSTDIASDIIAFEVPSLQTICPNVAGLVLQDASVLTIGCIANTAFVSLSAFRLAPSASEIFS